MLSLKPFRTMTVMPLIRLSACALAIFAMSAQASDMDDINVMLKSGKQAQALTKIEQLLTTKPRDAQLRFVKGVVQTELGKPQDAIGTFTKLTEDFPELPEPYNNLAVLHASNGQFDKARAALEMAIRTNPSYSTAHENLGDIYANLASQAYSKALQLGSSSTSLQPKLTLIRDLFAPAAKGVNPSLVAKPAAPVVATVTAPAAPALSASTAAATVTTAATPASATPAVKAAPVAAATAAPTPAPAATNADKEIEQAVMTWAKAWESKDMNAYLNAYAKSFDPPGSQSRASWEKERRDRIVGKNKISVKISDIDVKTNGDKATAVFRQVYNAGSLSANSRKTLEMSKAGNRWLITKEYTGG